MTDERHPHPVIRGLRIQAMKLGKRIAMPEYADDRTLRAAAAARDINLAQIVLVGDPDYIQKRAAELRIELSHIEIVNPEAEDVRRLHAEEFFELRRHKGISEQQAWEQVADPLYAAALMLRAGRVDGSVAGALNPTPVVLKPLLQIVKCPPGISTASSCFIIATPMEHMGVEGLFIFADGGVVPNPTPEQLADIAITSAESCRLYLNAEPRVAMLSFSTKGSAKHPDAVKVREATRLAQEKAPGLILDGEIQADAALVPEVAARKDSDGILQGQANVLVFPDLDAGNIGYKLVHRLAHANAYGPLVQGLAKAGMDLSRGASVNEIVTVIAIAAIRAEALAGR